MPSGLKQGGRRIEAKAIEQGYKKFSGGFRTYLLQARGYHSLLNVPADQKGALAPFRGKRIRLICIDYGNNVSSRIYVAKSI